MAGRMSNRERIERLRAEADAAAREKEAARAEKAARAPSTRSAGKAAPPRGRVRIVWNVCDPGGKEVKSFPYAQEAEARAAAAELTASTGRTHFVAQAEVPL